MVGARSAAWASGLVALALLLLALSPLPLASDVEARIGAIVAPPVTAVRDVVRPVTEVLTRAGQLRELADENASLRLALAGAETDLAALREQRTAVEAATALIQSVGPQADQFVAASVILRDPAPGRQLLLIDRGRRHGVRPGQPVLGAGSTLVGLVVEVDHERARVRLLHDRDSTVAAILQSSRLPASLAGTGTGMRLDFVEVGTDVVVGDVVLTSALGGVLPPGLLIGQVAEVRSRPQDLFAQVTVEPLADYRRIEQVLVMVGFTPGATLAGEPGGAR